jgi:hypothetical protein
MIEYFVRADNKDPVKRNVWGLNLALDYVCS